METFAEFLGGISDPHNRARAAEVLTWVSREFPDLVPTVKWNQPMFTNDGTFIVGFSASKHHLAVTPEVAGIVHFSAQLDESHYDHTRGIWRIKWEDSVDYELLKRMIEFNILDKKDYKTFWRKDSETLLL